VSEVGVQGGAPDGAPPELRRLARRDVRVTAAGLLAVLASLLLLAASAVGLVGRRHGETAVIGIALIAGFGCFVWWTAGPPALRRERLVVLAPLFLAAVPGLVALHDLGGGLAAVMASSVVGFGAAIALGMAYASRRR
jgi:hypothetical protein